MNFKQATETFEHGRALNWKRVLKVWEQLVSNPPTKV